MTTSTAIARLNAADPDFAHHLDHLLSWESVSDDSVNQRVLDIIKLYGSMELAPLIGLADKIIDVVDTGNTLRANGLEPQDFIADISSRLIVNKASMKMQHARIQALIDTLRNAVESRHRG